MPYIEKKINKIEALSLWVGFGTIYFGLWYLTGDISDEETKILLFSIIVFLNSIFVFVWLISYFGAYPWAKRFVKRFQLEKKFEKKKPPQYSMLSQSSLGETYEELTFRF